jgi:hypothetical protein
MSMFGAYLLGVVSYIFYLVAYGIATMLVGENTPGFILGLTQVYFLPLSLVFRAWLGHETWLLTPPVLDLGYALGAAFGAIQLVSQLHGRPYENEKPSQH